MPLAVEGEDGSDDDILDSTAASYRSKQAGITYSEGYVEVRYLEIPPVIASGNGYRCPFKPHKVDIAVLTEVASLCCGHFQFRYGPDRDKAVGSGIPQSEFPVSELQVYFICFRASRAFWAFPS